MIYNAGFEVDDFLPEPSASHSIINERQPAARISEVQAARARRAAIQ